MNTWIELDLNRLSSNIDNLRHALPVSCQIIFVVKANAYGHGMEQIAGGAWQAGVRWFAVAHISEALELRSILPEAKILIVGAIEPALAQVCVENRLVPVIISLEHAHQISAELSGHADPLECHVKIDTGMGRLGIDWQEAVQALEEIGGLKELALKGICTHFASSDGESREYFDTQCRRFSQVTYKARVQGVEVGFRHASNSGGVIMEPEMDLDGIRPGIMLYGYGRTEGSDRNVNVQPVLQWKANVVQVKRVHAGFPVSYDSTYICPDETLIATIDAGYSDGYPRALSNKGFRIAGGRRVPVAGRVTMNLMTVDLGIGSRVRAGDEVVLIGSEGGEAIWADEIAKWSGTISYEILTGIRAGAIKVM